MQLPQWLARFNRHVTNPIQRMWAGWAPLFGILEHAGRRSGTRYRTPLTVFNADVDGKPGVAILLTYGPKPGLVEKPQRRRRRPDATARQDIRRHQPSDRDQGRGGAARQRRGAADLP